MGVNIVIQMLGAAGLSGLVLWMHSRRSRVGGAPFYMLLGGLSVGLLGRDASAFWFAVEPVAGGSFSVSLCVSLWVGILAVYVFDGPRVACRAMAMSLGVLLLVRGGEFLIGALVVVGAIFLVVAWEALRWVQVRLLCWLRYVFPLVGAVWIVGLLGTLWGGAWDRSLWLPLLARSALLSSGAGAIWCLYFIRQSRALGREVVHRSVFAVFHKETVAPVASSEEKLYRLTRIVDRVPGVLYQYRLYPDGTSSFPYVSDKIREIYRVTPEEVRRDASSMFSVIHPDDSKEVASLIQASAKDLSIWRSEYRVKFDDGTVRWLHGAATPVREDDGSTLWHGFVCDITDRKVLECRVRQLAQHLETVREEERKHLARELHDDLGQILTALKMDLSLLEQACASDPSDKHRFDEMQSVLNEGIHSVLALCQQLRPSALDDLSLEDALRGLVADWQAQSSVRCDCQIDLDEDPLGDKLKTGVFRMVQEALTNVIRHAKASQVHVDLVSDGSVIHVVVSDDGRGMAQGAADKPSAFGLLGMRERIEMLGGELVVESSSGAGTRIEGAIPL